MSTQFRTAYYKIKPQISGIDLLESTIQQLLSEYQTAVKNITLVDEQSGAKLWVQEIERLFNPGGRQSQQPRIIPEYFLARVEMNDSPKPVHERQMKMMDEFRQKVGAINIQEPESKATICAKDIIH